MNGYVCIYKGKRIELSATSSFDAQCKAAKHFNVPIKKRPDIVVVLAEKDGKPVFHLPLG